MRRRLFLTIFLFALLAASCTVKADVLIIPPDNPFYAAHKSECMEVNYVYEAARPTMYYETPDQRRPLYPIDTGEKLHIFSIWDGSWGIELHQDGWVNLWDFNRLYCEKDFMKDHKAELFAVNGEIQFQEEEATYSWDISDGALDSSIAEAAEALQTATYPIHVWAFPGSDEIKFDFDDSDSGLAKQIIALYRDQEGRLWGRIEANDYAWLCLSSPSDNALPHTAPVYARMARGMSSPKQKQLGSGITTDFSGPGGPSLGLPAAAVGLVMLISGWLLIRLQKQSRQLKAK